MKTRAFSLTEILVACFIVILLTAVITSTVVRAKEQAKDEHCLNNLRQIGQALILYAAENDGFVPPFLTKRRGNADGSIWVPARPDLWRSSLIEFAGNKSIFYCPRDKTKGPNGPNWDSTYTSYETSGVYHESKILPGGIWQCPIDAAADSPAPYLRDRLFPDFEHRRPSWSLSLHGLSGNALFLDGRVKKMVINEGR